MTVHELPGHKVVPAAEDLGVAAAGTQQWVRVATVALLVLVLAAAFQGTRGLWEPDEGRYTAAALEMLRTGDWLHPQLNDWTPHYTKPPLTYWLLASSFAVFGHNEWAARLPGTVAFAGTSLLMWPLARRLCVRPGEDSADAERRCLVAPLLYVTTAGPFIASNVVSTDGLLTFLETLAVAGFAIAWFTDDRRLNPVGIALMWGGFGLAFLTKGPPGLLPLVAIAAFSVWTGGWRSTRGLLWPPGLVLFGVLGFGWFAVVCFQKPELVRYFLGYELLDRIASDTHDRNAAWYYAFTIYGPALAGGSLPWVPAALYELVRRRRANGKKPASDATRFLALWVLLPLSVFALSQSRMHLYVLPLMVPLVLVAVRAWPHAPLSIARERWFAAGWVAALLALRVTLALVPSRKDSTRLAEGLPPLPAEATVVVVADKDWRYGLALPFDRPVRLASRDTSPSENVRMSDALTEALDAGETPVLLVREQWAQAAASEAAEADVRLERLGDFEARHLYAVRPLP